MAQPRALTALDSSASALSPLDVLLHPVVFSRPLRLVEPASWVPHIPFAFWLVAASRPRTFVELGTQSGNSYSAFVQASQALGLDTACHAVDTWKGDQHAGFYGEEVFEEWFAFHERCFSACSSLIRSSFDDAVEMFPDTSIDLLHIDGLHTYDAVRHDFETWLPKLSDSSAVILHDTNVREGDFGVWKLWEELEREYPCFEFLHGYGLGIVGVGKALPAELKWLLEDVPADRQRAFIVRELFTALGEALLLQHEKTGQDQERAVLTERVASHAESLAKLQAERDAAQETVTTVRDDRAAAVARLRSELANRDADLERLRGARDESAAEVARLRKELGRRDAALAEALATNEERVVETVHLRADLAERAATIERIQSERDESAHKVHDLTRRLEEQHGELNRRTELLMRTYTKSRLRRRLRTAGTLFSWLLRRPLRRGWLQFTEYLALRRSRCFDFVYYLHNDLDVLAANVSPLIHYLEHGVREGRNPHPRFNTQEYLEAHPELAVSGRNPFVHSLANREQEPSTDAPDRRTPSHNGTIDAAPDKQGPETAGPDPGSDDAADASPRPSPDLSAGESSAASEVEATRSAFESLAMASLRTFLASEAKLVFPKVEKPRASIVILSYKKPHLTYQALESLLASEPALEFEVIVIDNASSAATQALLDRLENVRVRFNEDNAGFARANNVGAALARGEYVCFLNNDVIATRGWLSALLDRMEQDPICGAVGGKLLQLDGRLQEAGSIIWSDGSCLGYGRRDDPEAAPYRYARDVDFCSAACLLVRRDLFLDLGGFDVRFAPAYYEDADLCFAISRAGYRVIYEPRAAIFHLEFGSTGEIGALQLQRSNREKFSEKWRAELSSQCPASPRNVLRARDGRQGPRLLVIDDRVPESVWGAGSPRMRALLDVLVAQGYVVSYLAMLDEGEQSETRRELESQGVEVIAAPSDLPGFIASRSGLYDAAIVSRPHNAHVIGVLKELNPGMPVVYDAEAVFALRDVLRRQVEGEIFTEAEIDALISAEMEHVEGADALVTVSERERKVFAEHVDPSVPILVWGHAITVRRTSSSFEDRADLLIVGNLETPPNADALRILVTEVMPSLRRRLPCQLLAVGAAPSANLASLASTLDDFVQMPGFVDDLTPIYDRARVFVAPHRFSAGIPLKVVEAMAHGVPCVVSAILADQLGVRDGEQVLVSRNGEDFAACVDRLYRDRVLWESLQQNAYDFVQADFAPERMQESLATALTAILAAKQGEP